MTSKKPIETDSSSTTQVAVAVSRSALRGRASRCDSLARRAEPGSD